MFNKTITCAVITLHNLMLLKVITKPIKLVIYLQIIFKSFIFYINCKFYKENRMKHVTETHCNILTHKLLNNAALRFIKINKLDYLIFFF